MGSVCCGSFFVALIGFIKIMYELLAPEGTEQSGLLANLKKFCDCLCCLCISFLFNWLNSGAYTWINMAGDSYCTSAINAASLRAKNLASSAAMALLGIVLVLLLRSSPS